MSKNKKYENKYTIGLDLGTNSIGWACINNEVKDGKPDILKTNQGKRAWGVIEFPDAQTAKDRRIKRSSRRMLKRKKQRLKELNKLFLEYTKHNEDFIGESSYIEVLKKEEPKNIKKKYPTIYHLQNDLMHNETNSINKIYSAIYNLYKYRGHFLLGTGLSNKIKSEYVDLEIKEICQKIIEESNNDKITKTINKIQTNNISGIDKKDYNLLLENDDKGVNFNNEEDLLKIDEIEDAKIKKLFELLYKKYLERQKSELVENIYAEKVQFEKGILKLDLAPKQIKKYIINNDFEYRLLSDEKVSLEINGEVLIIENNGEVLIIENNEYKSIKNIEVEIKNNNGDKLEVEYIYNQEKYKYDNYLEKKIAQYEHNKIILKMVNKNKEFNLDKKKDQTKKHLVKINDEEYINLCEKSSFYYKKFMQKTGVKKFQIMYQKDKELNHLIPVIETWKIVETIIKKNKNMFTNFEDFKIKMEKLLKHRIPYFVGPISDPNKNEFAWIKYNKGFENKKVNYLNFNEAIDKMATATEFIARMRGKCSYIPTEYTLSKGSMIYQEYAILNEIHNLRYKNERNEEKFFKNEEILKIFDCFFKIQKNVSFKSKKTIEKLNDLLELTNEEKIEEINGFQDENKKFMTQYSTYIDLKKIDESLVDPKNIQAIEVIIDGLTVLPKDEEEIIKNFLTKKLNNISLKSVSNKQDIIDKLSKQLYSGFSNVSNELINNFKINQKTILELLREGKNGNFMSILTSKKLLKRVQIKDYTPLMEIQNKYFKEKVSILEMYRNNQKRNQILEKYIPNNPKIRKATNLVIKVIGELIRKFGVPKDIYIESTRENIKDKSIPAAKAKVIIEKSKQLVKELNLGKIDKEFKEKVKNNRDFRQRIELYIEQQGKCMISMQPIDINRISTYHIDHIIPQSKSFDDSMNNKCLIKSKYNLEKRENLTILETVSVDKIILMKWWETLPIAKIKLKRLKIKNQNSNEFKEILSKMLNRTLVETSQIILNVKNILVKSEELQNSKVELIKARVINIIRESMDIPKIRNLTPQHHAIDAYFAAVTGKEILPILYKKENKNEKITQKIKEITIEKKAKIERSIDLEWQYTFISNRYDMNFFKENYSKIEDNNKYIYIQNKITEKLNREGFSDNLSSEFKKLMNLNYSIEEVLWRVYDKFEKEINSITKLKKFIKPFNKYYKYKNETILAEYKDLVPRGILAKIDKKQNIIDFIYEININVFTQKIIKAFIEKNTNYYIIYKNQILVSYFENKHRIMIRYINSGKLNQKGKINGTEYKNIKPIKLKLKKLRKININLSKIKKSNDFFELIKSMKNILKDIYEIFNKTNDLFKKKGEIEKEIERFNRIIDSEYMEYKEVMKYIKKDKKKKILNNIINKIEEIGFEKAKIEILSQINDQLFLSWKDSKTFLGKTIHRFQNQHAQIKEIKDETGISILKNKSLTNLF